MMSDEDGLRRVSESIFLGDMGAVHTQRMTEVLSQADLLQSQGQGESFILLSASLQILRQRRSPYTLLSIEGWSPKRRRMAAKVFGELCLPLPQLLIHFEYVCWWRFGKSRKENKGSWSVSLISLHIEDSPSYDL